MRYVLTRKRVARGTDPATSWEAAQKFEQRETHYPILQILDEGDMTDSEIAVRFAEDHGYYDWHPQSPSGLRTRRKELCDAGLVANTGDTRPHLETGGSSIVWGLTPEGRERL